MKKSEEQLRAEFLAEAGELFDEMMSWERETEKPDLSQIEELVLRLRERLGERMAEKLLLRQEERQPVERAVCPKCGQAMEDKGQKTTQVASRLGQLKVERGYYHCPGCGQGFFPPG